MRARKVVLAIALAASCSVPRSSVRPPYLARAAITDTVFERTPLTDLMLAEGIPALRAVRLASGARELRIADWYSMIRGAAVPTLRLVEYQGGATGELAFVWPERPEWPRRYQHATRCAQAADSTRHCVYVVPRSSSPDWRAVAAKLDSLGAWTLSERCEDNRVIDDAGDLILERLEGARFDAYRCNAPQFRTQTTVGARAAAIYEYFNKLAGAVPWR